MLRKLIPIAALLILAGCQPQGSIIGGTPPPKVYKKVVSLSPSASELMGATGRANQILIGRTSSCNFPNDVFRAVVVADVKPDFEKLATMKPDLILYDKDLYNENDVAKIKQLGADVWVLDATTIDKFEAQAMSLASMIGGESQMSQYFDNVHKAMETAKAGLTGKGPTVALILPGTGGEHMIAGTESFQASELQAATATPVGPKADKFVTLNPEELIKDDPEFIVTAGPPDEFLKDSRFANLQAVKKKGHLFGINQDIAVRRGFRVDRFIQDIYSQMQAAQHG